MRTLTIRLSLLLLVACCVVVTSSCAAPAEPALSRGGTYDPRPYAEQLYALTNEKRAAEGIERLKWSPCAAAAATARASQLVGYELSHAPMGPVLNDCSAQRAGENLVDSAAAAELVVEAWMNSPGHRNNIVDTAFSHLGVGCARHGEQLLCAQIYLEMNRPA
ncbi:CAP domain-containing protein [Georgenia daeguensis]|uniref:CAP domain-containing protein n=1 Tax=Georgenia daeguensis TaxID=908355 RepID=UPI003CD06077